MNNPFKPQPKWRAEVHIFDWIKVWAAAFGLFALAVCLAFIIRMLGGGQ